MDFLLIWRCSYQRGQWIFVTSKLTQNLKLHVCIPWWIFLHVNKKRNFQENYRTCSFRKVQKITRMRKLYVEHKEILIFFSLFFGDFYFKFTEITSGYISVLTYYLKYMLSRDASVTWSEKQCIRERRPLKAIKYTGCMYCQYWNNK